MSSSNAKKPYHSPQLERLGSVEELTQIGFTQPGADGVFHAQEGFEGSVDNPANPGGGTIGGR